MDHNNKPRTGALEITVFVLLAVQHGQICRRGGERAGLHGLLGRLRLPSAVGRKAVSSSDPIERPPLRSQTAPKSPLSLRLTIQAVIAVLLLRLQRAPAAEGAEGAAEGRAQQKRKKKQYAKEKVGRVGDEDLEEMIHGADDME